MRACVCVCVCMSCVVEDGAVLVQAQYSSSELGVEAFVAAQVVRRTTLQLLHCLKKLYKTCISPQDCYGYFGNPLGSELI